MVQSNYEYLYLTRHEPARKTFHCLSNYTHPSWAIFIHPCTHVIHLSIHLSVHHSICHQSINQSVAYPSIQPSIHQSTSIHPSVNSTISGCPYIHLSIHPSFLPLLKKRKAVHPYLSLVLTEWLHLSHHYFVLIFVV